MDQIISSRTLTVATLVMDASMSMRRFQNAPRDALNEFIQDCRRSPVASDIAVQIVTFAAAMFQALPLTKVDAAPSIDHIQNSPGTRLYATVRDVMISLADDPRMRKIDRLNHVFAVFTDGEDVLSTEEDRLQLCQLATFVARRGWDLLTFGFGVDARHIARQMGFPTDANHAKTVAADVQSVSAVVSATRERTITTASGWTADIPPWIPPR